MKVSFAKVCFEISVALMVFPGILKGRLDLEYTTSNGTQSALHIIQPGPDLSGDYTCVVSTFTSEDRKTKRMLVFGKSDCLLIRQRRIRSVKRATGDEGQIRFVPMQTLWN